MVEERAKDQRRNDAADVEAGGDEAEHEAIGARRRDRAHDQVARGHGQAREEARGGHHQHEREGGESDASDQHAQAGGRDQPAGGDQAMARGVAGEHAAGEHAGGAHDQEPGQRDSCL